MSQLLRLESRIALAFSIILLLASFYFFINALNLITLNEPKVAASILSTIIGIVTLSASITILRTWIIARAYEKGEEPQAGVR